MTARSENKAPFYRINGQAINSDPLAPGLYVVATPIGNLKDITLRALSVLAAADVIACEDTRITAKLLNHYGIETSMTAYHEHNAARKRPALMARLNDGQAVALVSDAGTPLVSDPGYRLVGEALAAGHGVTPIPGPSALLAGLVASGLPSDTVLFAGFLPTKAAARRKRIVQIGAVAATIVLYETPRRITALVADLADLLGPGRRAAIGRELTKTYESVLRGPLEDLKASVDTMPKKGELVLVLEPPDATKSDPAAVDAYLAEALKRMPASAAAREVATLTGLDRRQVYQRALQMKDGAQSTPKA